MKPGYRYFLLGSRPIRITQNARGGWIDAEAPDKATGALVRDITLMSRIRLNWEADEIDEETFNALLASP